MADLHALRGGHRHRHLHLRRRGPLRGPGHRHGPGGRGPGLAAQRGPGGHRRPGRGQARAHRGRGRAVQRPGHRRRQPVPGGRPGLQRPLPGRVHPRRPPGARPAGEGGQPLGHLHRLRRTRRHRHRHRHRPGLEQRPPGQPGGRGRLRHRRPGRRQRQGHRPGPGQRQGHRRLAVGPQAVLLRPRRRGGQGLPEPHGGRDPAARALHDHRRRRADRPRRRRGASPLGPAAPHQPLGRARPGAGGQDHRHQPVLLHPHP